MPGHDDYPDDESPEQSLQERLIHRSQWTWRLCLLLPFCYLGIAWLVDGCWFSGARRGFLPMRGDMERLTVALVGGFTFSAQIGIVLLRRRFGEILKKKNHSKIEVAYLYWKRTLWLVCCADIPSGLGLILFLLLGNWNYPMAFCACSYVLYAQAYPRARIITE